MFDQNMELIEETSFSSLHSSQKIVRNIVHVDNQDPTIFILCYDGDVIYPKLDKLGFLQSNCSGYIVPSRVFTINNRKYNNKEYYYKVKEQATTSSGKKISIVSSPSSLKKESYYYYDVRPYIESLKFNISKMNLKRGSYLFLEELSKLKYNIKIKTQKPVNVQLLFAIDSSDSILLKVLEEYKILLNKNIVNNLDLFDNMFFGSTLSGEIIPLINYQNDKLNIIDKNFKYITSKFQSEDLEKIINKTLNYSDDEYFEDSSNNKLDKDTKDIQNSFETISQKLSGGKAINIDYIVNDDSKTKTKISIDNNILRTVLETYGITDPDIVANVRTALNSYLNKTDNKVNQDRIEETIIKAIHYSVHGTEELKEEYYKDPNKLIEKLKQQSTHKVPLNISNTDNTIFNPSKVIDLNETTGVWRQKQEFEEEIHKNVEKLFKSLEDKPENPIEVKNIDYELDDTNNNRLLKYTITLQNKSGKNKKPYKVQLDVPGIVNDRYFKLNNSNYIMPSQQFMKPITKTNSNEVRLLTNFGVVNLTLKNVRFNPVNVKEIINYIRIRYNQLIEEETEEYVKFKDDSVLHFYGDVIYSDKEYTVKEDENGNLVNNDGETLNELKYEYIYRILRLKIKSENPEDNLSKSKKSIPYVNLHISGFNVPFILYLWSQKGLLSSLNDLGIDYEVTESRDSNYTIKKSDGKILNIYPSTVKGEYICNGLIQLRINHKFDNLDDREEIKPILEKNYGSTVMYGLNKVTQNSIDPITKEILQFEDLPTDFVNLITTECTDKLFNGDVENLSDLNIYRSRLSEMMLNMMYQQIQKAHSKYSNEVNTTDNETQLSFKSTEILENIQSEGILQEIMSSNPVEELNLASRVIKTGPQGVPGKKSFKLSHRNIHNSHIGNLGALTTPESADVGVVLSHTLTPLIMNEYGSYGKKNPESLNGWNTLTANELLTPFQNQVDSDRMMLASIHSKQSIPTSGSEQPLVGTGAEYVIPQISSSRFTQKAEDDGEVVDIEDGKTMTVKYKNGNTKVFDTLPRTSRTKMGAFISLKMEPSFSVGDKFKKDDIIAHTKNFNDSGVYCSGKNCVMAMMQYNGQSHEDAYTVSENMSDSMKRDIIKKAEIVIPPNTKVLNIETEENKDITHNDILVEFQYDSGLDDYLQNIEMQDVIDDSSSEEDFSESGRDFYAEGNDTIQLKGKNGEIVDIKIYINNKNSIDPKVVDFHKQKVKDTNDLIKKLNQNVNDPNEQIKSTDNLELDFMNTGGHKLKGGAEFKGARIVYYIKQQQSLKEGDKIASRYGAKGVISKVIPENKTPYTNNMGNIDVFISPVGVFSRKNIAMVKELYIGKIIYKLREIVKEKAKNTKTESNEIEKLIIDVYSLISPENVLNSIKQNISNFKPNLKKAINDDKLKLTVVIPPFSDVTFENIKTAADVLETPLDEKVYIPELDSWSKDAVPVGISYMQSLEQTSEVYSNVRSMGKYQSLTGQPVKGKAQGGGQSIGQLDVNAFLTYDIPSVRDELLSLRADDHKAKRSMINSIVNTGNSKLVQTKQTSQSKNLFDIYLTSMGVSVLDD